MASTSDEEAIRQVMAQCPKCSKETASDCLELLYGNDVAKAVEKFRQIEDILQPDPPGDDENDDARSLSSNDQGGNDTPTETSEVEDNSVKEGPPWMPKLPVLAASEAFLQHRSCGSDKFELKELLGAIQTRRFKAGDVRTYFRSYDDSVIKTELNVDVEGYPAMFYIVSTNDVGIIREWIKKGGDANATWGPDSFPLIAFAILHGGKDLLQAIQTLMTLLRFGADPRVVPRAFYEPFFRDLPADGPTEQDLDDIGDENKRWCTADVRAYLVKSLNFTQRYYLYRSSKIKPPSGREKTLLVRQEAEEILGVHQMIVGQSIALRLLKKRLLVHLALQTNRPLILVFAGPSGHGKTELARRFGDLMSLQEDLHVVDCTTFQQDNELFGPRPPYAGHEEGSQLNNFLVTRTGDRCIVFMDEFEKTSKEIHNTLLLPFEHGQYQDRRKGKTVDCSKTIWILATNRLDESIHAFCRENEKALFSPTMEGDEQAQRRLGDKLCGQLRQEFVGHFRAPLAGRISEIVPFVEFSPAEAAVIAHRKLVDLERMAMRRMKLALNAADDVYVGNSRVAICRDASVSEAIARDGYTRETGARSIARAVERTAVDPLVTQLLESGDRFDENEPISHFVVDMNVEKEVEVRFER